MIKYLLPFLLLSFNAYSACLDDAYTTVDMMDCYTEELKVEGQKLEDTLTKAYKDSDWIANEIRLSQEAWMKYREAHCNAIYTSYGRGTMRLIAYPSCMVRLTKQRTEGLQRSFTNP